MKDREVRDFNPSRCLFQGGKISPRQRNTARFVDPRLLTMCGLLLCELGATAPAAAAELSASGRTLLASYFAELDSCISLD